MRIGYGRRASDTGNSGALVFFLFDLLHLDGEAIAPMPVTERKERLRALLSGSGSPLHFSDHQIGRGPAFYDHACTLKSSRSGSMRSTLPAIAACGLMPEPRGIRGDRLDRS
jgi:hypothetical protein